VASTFNEAKLSGSHRPWREAEVCGHRSQSVVAVGHKPHADCAGEVLGIIAVGDTMRPNAPDAIHSLHATGVQKVVMLSGDNQRTVNAIARQAGVDEAYGDIYYPIKKLSMSVNCSLLTATSG
jgi:cation transport ATPase